MIMKTEELTKMLDLTQEYFDDVLTTEFCELYAEGKITINIIPNLKSTKELLKDFIIVESTNWLVVDNLTNELYEKLDADGYFPYANDNSSIKYFKNLEYNRIVSQYIKVD